MTGELYIRLALYRVPNDVQPVRNPSSGGGHQAANGGTCWKTNYSGKLCNRCFNRK